MKKLVIAALVASAATPAFSFAPVQLTDYGTFSSRGKCESALAHERNRQRKDASQRGSGYENLSGSEFNRASLRTTTCEQVSDGVWAFMYDADAD